MIPSMQEKISRLYERYLDLETQLADPAIVSKQATFQKLAKERADLEPLVSTYKRCEQIEKELVSNEELIRDSDADLRAMAKEEELRLLAEKNRLEEELKILMLPKDPRDEKNVMLEIRAGAGGEEASLFAADLFRMYLRFAERKRWKVEIFSQSESSSGGIKEAIAMISAPPGGKVYSNLKYESGVHRVQRVPSTESQGRVHTSVATVAVLAEVEDVDVKLEDKDLRIEVMRSGGPGAQSVNTTDSAVQIMHIPSGIIVRCQQEKSQHKNKALAMKILRSKLYEIEREKRDAEEREARRAQVKTGERSDKIRTYNFPQDRFTDHRVPYTRHNLPAIMDGDLQDIVDTVRAYFQVQELSDF